MDSIPLLQTSNDLSKQQAHFSKWNHLDVLLDPHELKALFDIIKPCWMLYASSTKQTEDYTLPFDLFYETYQNYIENLKQKTVPNIASFRTHFHFFLTQSLEGIYRVPLGESHQRILLHAPVIQVKPISLMISKIDSSIHTSPISPQGIFWGLRFSFPGIFQKPNSLDITTLNPNNHINANLFKIIRGFLRKESSFAIFEIDQTKHNALARLGKQCYPWIQNHPQLSADIKIVNATK